MFAINLAVLAVFALSYHLAGQFHLDFLKVIPGLLLLYYLPGHNFNDLVFKKREKISTYLRVPLDILSSISILTILYLLTKNFIKFDELRLIWLVVGTNLFFTTISLFQSKRIKFSKIVLPDKLTLVILFIPILLFTLRLILNPYIFDIDSLLYFDFFENILEFSVNDRNIFSGRGAFSFFMMNSHYVAGLNYTLFAKFITPIIFYISLLPLFEFVNDKGRSILSRSVILLSLSSPMLIIMAESVRPEAYSLAFTIPVLILTYLAVKDSKWNFGSLALLYSFTVYRFHESGVILFLSALVSIIILFVRDFPLIYAYVKKNLRTVIFVLISYTITFKLLWPSFNSFLTEGMTKQFFIIAEKGLKNIKWDWWFIDNAVTVHGARIGWPGISSLYYYLYNGTILIFLALAIWIIYLAGKNRQKPVIIALIPIGVFFFIHFAVAEILPRLGTVLLPNRAWPYVAAAMIVEIVILINQLRKQRRKEPTRKILALIIIAVGFFGVALTTYASTNMGGMVMPQEKRAIQIIRNLPSDALIVSSQRNHNLVRIYGQKDFMILSKFSPQENFVEGTKEYLQSRANELIKSKTDTVVIKKFVGQYVQYQDYLNTYTQETKKLEDLTEEEKLEFLKNLDPDHYNLLQSQINDLRRINDREVYFVYSFDKLKYGLLAKRGWWLKSSDIDNLKYFENYQGDVVAKDKDFILIRIN